jgi:hypothetical protein
MSNLASGIWELGVHVRGSIAMVLAYLYGCNSRVYGMLDSP